MNFDQLYNVLSSEIDALRLKFIAPFLPANPEHEPRDFEHQVKAFSVLCHAAFEEFVESVSEHIMRKIEDDVLRQKTTTSTVCFLATYGVKFNLSDNESEQEQTCFARIRSAIEEAKRQHSKSIMDNHGFSPKYMRRLLVPVGIDMPTGPNTSSLIKLAEARGSFAHTMSKLAYYGQYKRAKKLFAPEEAWAAAQDCLAICDTIKNRANALE